jgi:hypothetical protein
MANPACAAVDGVAPHGVVACQQVGGCKEPHLVGCAPPSGQQWLLVDGIGRTFTADGMEGTGHLVPPPKAPHILLNPGKTRLGR